MLTTPIVQCAVPLQGSSLADEDDDEVKETTSLSLSLLLLLLLLLCPPSEDGTDEVLNKTTSQLPALCSGPGWQKPGGSLFSCEAVTTIGPIAVVCSASAV
jgi:hypothetical protein